MKFIQSTLLILLTHTIVFTEAIKPISNKQLLQSQSIKKYSYEPDISNWMRWTFKGFIAVVKHSYVKDTEVDFAFYNSLKACAHLIQLDLPYYSSEKERKKFAKQFRVISSVFENLIKVRKYVLHASYISPMIKEKTKAITWNQMLRTQGWYTYITKLEKKFDPEAFDALYQQMCKSYMPRRFIDVAYINPIKF